MLTFLALILVSAFAGGSSRAQDTGGSATNEADNPLTARVTVNLQDTPSFYGPLNSDANSLPQGYGDGLGDLTVFDLFVLPSKPVLLAVGPLFVAPTATDRFTGAGRRGIHGRSTGIPRFLLAFRN